jgi:hypothetical protein
MPIDIGSKVNGFTVLRNEWLNKNKIWICACDCGNEKIFWKLSAITKQKTCGCGVDEAGLTAKQRRSVNSRMNSYKQGAKTRGFDWNLSYLEFVEITTKNCMYCDASPKSWDCISGAPSLQKDSPNVNSEDYQILFNGIDRINSDEGYDIDNCVPCCTSCNRSKSDLSLSEFKQHVERMYKCLFPNE